MDFCKKFLTDFCKISKWISAKKNKQISAKILNGFQQNFLNGFPQDFLNGFLQNKLTDINKIFQMEFCKVFQMDFQYFWLGLKGPIIGPVGPQRCSRRAPTMQPKAAIFSSYPKTEHWIFFFIFIFFLHLLFWPITYFSDKNYSMKTKCFIILQWTNMIHVLVTVLCLLCYNVMFSFVICCTITC